MPRDRLRHPPSNITGELGEYLREIHRLLNNQPQSSYFSGTDPNTSAITGRPGDIVVNIGSASTSRRMWIMSGVGSSYLTSGWKPVRIA